MYDFSQILIDSAEVETVDDYLWAELQEHYFDPPEWYLEVTPRSAIRLYERGLFGRILDDLDRVDWDRIEHAVAGDCAHCGEPSVGGASPEYRGSYDLPDGQEVFVTYDDAFCDDCLEKYIHDLTTYGEVQPTLAGWSA